MIQITLSLMLGLVVGAVIATIIVSRRMKGRAAANMEQAAEEARKATEQTYKLILEQKENAQSHLLEEKERAHQAALDQRDKAHKEAMDDLRRYFNAAIDGLKAQIKADTEEMLKTRQKEFAVSSSKDIGDIVSPLKEALGRMHQAMADGDKERSRLSGQMQEQILNMKRQAEKARESADALTRAFTRENKTQGNMGEVVLYELLRSSGLTEGVHYEVQTRLRNARGESVVSEEGRALVPDVLLHLDDKREVIIDSKVSIRAFIEYVNSEDEIERARWIKEHVESLWKHVKELSAKDYSSYIQPPKIKMNYVIMFVPNSAALWAALNHQPNLWRQAMEKGVYIADEQTLYAALKIISLTWTQITQAQNHAEVYKLADEMVKRVGMFFDKYQEVGKALSQAQTAYEDGEKRLGEKGTSIKTTCSKLLSLGAKQSDKYPIPGIEEAYIQ